MNEDTMDFIVKQTCGWGTSRRSVNVCKRCTKMDDGVCPFWTHTRGTDVYCDLCMTALHRRRSSWTRLPVSCTVCFTCKSTDLSLICFWRSTNNEVLCGNCIADVPASALYVHPSSWVNFKATMEQLHRGIDVVFTGTDTMGRFLFTVAEPEIVKKYLEPCKVIRGLTFVPIRDAGELCVKFVTTTRHTPSTDIPRRRRLRIRLSTSIWRMTGGTGFSFTLFDIERYDDEDFATPEHQREDVYPISSRGRGASNRPRNHGAFADPPDAAVSKPSAPLIRSHIFTKAILLSSVLQSENATTEGQNLPPTTPSTENVSAANKATEGDALCVICLSNAYTIVLLPCCHLCLCDTCHQRNTQEKSPCPLCRRDVEGSIRVFSAGGAI